MLNKPTTMNTTAPGEDYVLLAEPLLLTESEPESEPEPASTSHRSVATDGEEETTTTGNTHVESRDIINRTSSDGASQPAGSPNNATTTSNNDGDNDTTSPPTTEFAMASRGQVKGAAAVFGITGLVMGGPILGLVAAAGSAHFAANKTGGFANFTRRCGAYLEHLGDKKTDEQLDVPTSSSSKGVAKSSSATLAPTKKTKKNAWDKITDGLIKGAEWTEGKLTRRH